MTHRHWILSVLAFAMVASVSVSVHGGKLQTDGKSGAEVEAEALKTGVVQRALRGKLLLTTVQGVLSVEEKDGVVVGATLVADTEEVYDYKIGTGYRSAIMEVTPTKVDKTFTIPPEAAHFNLVRTYMDGLRVEANMQLDKPNGRVVTDMRFVGVLAGQKIVAPVEPPSGFPEIGQGVVKPAGRELFVSPDGSDSNNGSEGKPFATIAKGVASLKAGETLYLRAGTYHEVIRVSELVATKEAPVLIAGYPGEEARVDASESLGAIADGPWKKHSKGVFKRQLKKDVTQLWKDGEMLMLARWPKVTKNWTEEMEPQFNGRMPEPGTAWNFDDYYARFDPSEAKSNFDVFRRDEIRDDNYPFKSTPFDGKENCRKLALRSLMPLDKFGKSLEGAVIEGPGIVGTQALITKHEAGSNDMEIVFANFDEEFGEEVGLGRFVIKNHLNCLDSPKEWVYDSVSKTLYVKMGVGDLPAVHKYRAKTANFQTVVRKSANIQFKDIEFYGCSFMAFESPGTIVEDCRFLYPTYRPTTLLAQKMETAKPGVGEKVKSDDEGDKFIPCALAFMPGGTLLNCELAYYQSSGIEMSGDPSLIENCYLHHGESYGIIFSRNDGCVARRNTIHSTLRQGAIRIRKAPLGRFISELNYGYDYGCHRSDASGTQVQSGSQNFHVFRNNWFHHSECKALRFDGQPAGTLGLGVDSVGWRLWQGMQIKGDYQKAYNNTFFECGARCDISVVNQIGFGGGTHTITRNNLCDRISGHRTEMDLDGEGRIPGFHDHNWNGLVTGGKTRDLLRDPANYDFRPLKNAEVVDAGTLEIDDRFAKGSTLHNLVFVKAEGSTRGAPDDPAYGGGGPYNTHIRRYLGKAPDLGAYEYGDTYYWIPGRQLDGASFPIPPNDAKYVKSDADLMWLEGRRAVASDVYFGTNRARVAKADKSSTEYMGRFTDSNICAPKGGLEKDKTYYWRVDTTNVDGSMITGAVWSFRPGDGAYEEYRRIDTPASLAAELRDDKTVRLKWESVDDRRLVGYNIYRRWGNFVYVKLNGECLTRTPVTETLFVDTTISEKGKNFYVIEAVDNQGIPSYESEPVEIDLR